MPTPSLAFAPALTRVLSRAPVAAEHCLSSISKHMVSHKVLFVLTTLSSLLLSTSSLSMMKIGAALDKVVVVVRSRHSRHVQREFVFVTDGAIATSILEATASEQRPTISCDGRIPGVTLELTHWKNNQTPDPLYADTSTSMALKLAEASDHQEFAHFQNALIMNNHYDTDGLMSTFACLEPELALEHAKLLLSAAEAGDFGEWNTDEGVQLHLALEAWLDEQSISKDEAEATAYATALDMLPDLLHDFQTQGENSKHLWKGPWNRLVQEYDHFAKNLDKNILPATACPKDMAIVIEPSQPANETPNETPTHRMSSLAIYRAMQESGHWTNQMGIAGGGPIRILRVQPVDADDGDDPQEPTFYHYNYEMIGHGWVQRLVQRRRCSDVPSIDDLVEKLNAFGGGDDTTMDENPIITWKRGGISGLISICHTVEAVQTTPQVMASRLAMLDQVVVDAEAARNKKIIQ